jgi:predicted ATPase
MTSPFLPIRRIRLKRFRSYLWANVELANPLFLVGKNGAGKSNFLKALEFLASSMSLPLESVFQLHGGIETVRYRTGSRSRPGNFGIRVDFTLPGDIEGYYVFEIKAMQGFQFKVVREQCVAGSASFDREGDQVKITLPGITPRVIDDALLLPLLGGTEEFEPVVVLLGGIQVFSLEPRLIQELQKPDAGTSLKGDGSNLASVLKNLPEANLARLCELLGSVVPGVTSVSPARHGKSLTLKFTQKWPTEAGEEEISHEAFAMSDGTMRIVGILCAFLQTSRPSIIALEEPESTIHPEALGALLETIRGFATTTQVIVTTHSPDLLDCKWMEPANIRVITWSDGITRIQKLSEAGAESLRQHLMGAGEMMRTEGLQPEEIFDDINPEQSDFFTKFS